ncbi:uncharacterized protein LOC129583306 [Paramacrobiotus metropolitanus]|uniref:uncharacterized protein LOC129583306 n=1 Tax=Paramacrobiotus metropolitanus TaxID=2943436 RepID=UPI00244605A8|nr:uncharacterized protein LOC129583306 [Paramacrobiotus metropolitanus]
MRKTLLAWITYQVHFVSRCMFKCYADSLDYLIFRMKKVCVFLIALGALLRVAAIGSPDVNSAPVFTMRYMGHYIKVFQTVTANSTDPTFYYTPTCMLFPNISSVKESPNPSITIRIGLSDEDYLHNISQFIAQRTGTKHPHLLPIPFRWMRIEGFDSNLRPAYIKDLGKSVDKYPDTILFRIQCVSLTECNQLAESMKTDSEHFASNLQLAFSYQKPNTSKLFITIEADHVHASVTFSAISERFPDASYAFLQKADLDDLVRETVMKSIESSLESDEFMDTGQMDSMIRQVSGKMRHNVTSTVHFTEADWHVTFWHDENKRPDVKTRHLEALFSDGMNWLQREVSRDNLTEAVAEALDELKRGVGPVKLDGKRIVIRPMKLYCIDLAKLRGQPGLGSFSPLVTKSIADYSSYAHSMTHVNPMSAVNVRSDKEIQNHSHGDITSVERQLNETFERRLQAFQNYFEAKLQLAVNKSKAVAHVLSLLEETMQRVTQLEANITQAFHLKENDSGLQSASEELKPLFYIRNDSLDEIAQRINQMETRNEGLLSNTTDLANMYASLQRNVSSLARNLDDLAEKATPQASAIRELKKSAALMENKITLVNQTCEANSLDLAAMVGRFLPITAQLQSLTERSDNLIAVSAGSDSTKVPIGSIVAFTSVGGMNSCWLECNGAYFSTNSYPKLYNVLGSTILPDLGGRFLLGRNYRHSVDSTGGEESHTLTVAEMPQHSHAAAYGGEFMDMSGKYGFARYSARSLYLSESTDKVDTNRNTARTGGGSSHNNMPPYRTVMFFIRAC